MTSLASEERYATLLEWFDGMVSGWRMITFIGVLLVLLSFLNMKAADILVMSCSLFPVHRFAMRIFAES
ncbi:Listeria nuclear targeted protein [Dirofilaria immitis]